MNAYFWGSRHIKGGTQSHRPFENKSSISLEPIVLKSSGTRPSPVMNPNRLNCFFSIVPRPFAPFGLFLVIEGAEEQLSAVLVILSKGRLNEIFFKKLRIYLAF